jgi:hypothetical protein
MDGMQLSRGQVPLDYNHDTSEVIGYLNHFSVDSEGLQVAGVLTPYRDQDRASEIIYKMGQGVPYEASINFAGQGIKVQEIPEGRSTEVNGFEFQGPGVVIREWPLRGVAITPYGADSSTRVTAFGDDAEVTVEIEEVEMADEKQVEAVETEVSDAVETVDSVETPEVEESVEEVSDTQEEVVAAGAGELSDRAVEGKRFLAAFGPLGGVWFAEGLEFSDAQQRYIKTLEEKVDFLTKRVEEPARVSGDDGAEFSDVTETETKLDARKFQQQGLPSTAASFAANFEKRLS